jgi:hypothetical protein
MIIKLPGLTCGQDQCTDPSHIGQWCACSRKLIPVGALAIWQDGVTHRVEGCEADQ